MISIPFRLWRALVAAVLATGCASYESRPLVPEEELAALRTRTLETVRIEPARPGAVRPRTTVFDPANGLSEDEVVAVALTLNPRLRAKRLEIGEAEALLVGAGLWPNPTLDLAVRPGIDGASSTGIGLDLLFALLRPGERSARRGVALAELDAVRAAEIASELAVVAEARKARLGVLAAEQEAELLESESALREQASAMLHRRKDLGEAKDLDLLLVDLDLSEIRRELRVARAGRERACRDLNEVLGLPATCDVRLEDSGRALAFVVPAELSDEELDRRLLSGRFDLRAKEAQYRRAEEELRLAVARQFPGLGVGPSFEQEIEGSKSLGLGASIEIPLFDRNQGEIAQKHAARERARAEYVASLHALRAAAFEARAEVQRARTEVETLQREVLPLVERTEVLFEGAFQARELSIFEWITARTRALGARGELARALVHCAGAVAELEAALGAPEGSTDGEENEGRKEG